MRSRDAIVSHHTSEHMKSIILIALHIRRTKQFSCHKIERKQIVRGLIGLKVRLRLSHFFIIINLNNKRAASQRCCFARGYILVNNAGLQIWTAKDKMSTNLCS